MPGGFAETYTSTLFNKSIDFHCVAIKIISYKSSAVTNHQGQRGIGRFPKYFQIKNTTCEIKTAFWVVSAPALDSEGPVVMGLTCH